MIEGLGLLLDLGGWLLIGIDRAWRWSRTHSLDAFSFYSFFRPFFFLAALFSSFFSTLLFRCDTSSKPHSGPRTRGPISDYLYPPGVYLDGRNLCSTLDTSLDFSLSFGTPCVVFYRMEPYRVVPVVALPSPLCSFLPIHDVDGRNFWTELEFGLTAFLMMLLYTDIPSCFPPSFFLPFFACLSLSCYPSRASSLIVCVSTPCLSTYVYRVPR